MKLNHLAKLIVLNHIWKKIYGRIEENARLIAFELLVSFEAVARMSTRAVAKSNVSSTAGRRGYLY